MELARSPYISNLLRRVDLGTIIGHGPRVLVGGGQCNPKVISRKMLRGEGGYERSVSQILSPKWPQPELRECAKPDGSDAKPHC